MKNNMKYRGTIISSGSSPKNRIFIGVPMTGLLRSEWVRARYGQMIPCNWSNIEIGFYLDQWSPLGFAVAEARNLIVDAFLNNNCEWLLFIDHDVILPPNTMLIMNEYMLSGDVPIVNGLYFTKSKPSEPLVYRGRGNSYFGKWNLGDKVWADGCGLGCTLIHHSIIRDISSKSESVTIKGKVVKRVFTTPCASYFDIENRNWVTRSGTEDLHFYDRLVTSNVYADAGWGDFQKKKYPLLVDTRLFCRHIDFDGRQYPDPSDIVGYIKGNKRGNGKFNWGYNSLKNEE